MKIGLTSMLPSIQFAGNRPKVPDALTLRTNRGKDESG